jgi:hypothetical protein
VHGCRALLRGDDVDHDLLVALAGPPAGPFAPGMPAREDTYWLRVWGARGLLWAYDPSALPELRAAAHDDHWRVREMVMKVVARHRVDELLDDALGLRDDDVPRVRAAAARALASLTAAG